MRDNYHRENKICKTVKDELHYMFRKRYKMETNSCCIKHKESPVHERIIKMKNINGLGKIGEYEKTMKSDEEGIK